jgi:hypothetical protein
VLVIRLNKHVGFKTKLLTEYLLQGVPFKTKPEKIKYGGTKIKSKLSDGNKRLKYASFDAFMCFLHVVGKVNS